MQKKTARRCTSLRLPPSPRRPSEKRRRSQSSAPSTSTRSRRRSRCLWATQEEPTRWQARAPAPSRFYSSWPLLQVAKTTPARAKMPKCLANDPIVPIFKLDPAFWLDVVNPSANTFAAHKYSYAFCSFASLKLSSFLLILLVMMIMFESSRNFSADYSSR